MIGKKKNEEYDVEDINGVSNSNDIKGMSPMMCIIIITIGCILFIGIVATIKNARVVRKSEQKANNQRKVVQQEDVTRNTGSNRGNSTRVGGSRGNSNEDTQVNVNKNTNKSSNENSKNKTGDGDNEGKNSNDVQVDSNTKGTSDKDTSNTEEVDKFKVNSNTNNNGSDTQETGSDSVEPVNGSNADTQETDSDSIEPVESSVVLRVDEPKLGELKTTAGMVSNKGVLKIENSYCYCINFIVPTNSGGYGEVVYYCPKSTYDKVTVGSTLNIDFQYDESGSISVESIHN